jgi:2-keto-3-deoxy-6-phosphogluconate aldolase
MSDLIQQLRALRIVPVITIQNAEDAVPLAEALTSGGLPCAEITFRTAAGAEALRRIAAEQPDMLVGAGTVLTTQQAQQARRVARSSSSPPASTRPWSTTARITTSPSTRASAPRPSWTWR